MHVLVFHYVVVDCLHCRVSMTCRNDTEKFKNERSVVARYMFTCKSQ